MRPPRGEAGRMIELQIVFFFALLGVAISIAKHSVLKGFGLAALYLVGFFAGLLILGLALEKAAAVASHPRLAVLRAPAAGLAAAVAGAALGGFVAIFLAPALASTPEGQLTAMRALAGVPGLLCGVWAFVATRRSQRGADAKT